MDSREADRRPARSDDLVLRTFALLTGVVLAVLGVVGLAADLVWNGAAAQLISLSGSTSASAAALVVGAALAYWGARRRRADHSGSEEALSKLVEKYEREGDSQQLADARERLIQLLIDKDEQKDGQERT